MFGNGGLSASDCCLFGRSHGHAIAHNFFLSVIKPILALVIHQNSQRDVLCHFDQREKSFLDPSHSLGMTVLRPSLRQAEGTPSTQRIAQAEVCLSKNRNPVYWTLVQ